MFSKSSRDAYENCHSFFDNRFKTRITNFRTGHTILVLELHAILERYTDNFVYGIIRFNVICISLIIMRQH